jgi:hypothetical protein
MKTTNSILFLLFFLYFNANSQLALNFSSLKHLPIKVGLEAGLNVSSVQLRNVFSDGGDFKPSYNMGLRVGLDITYRINYYFDIESGIFYKNLGQKMSATNVDLPIYYLNDYDPVITSVPWNGGLNPVDLILSMNHPYDYTETNMTESYDFQYLNVPFKLKYKFNNFYMSTGVYGAILLDGKYKRTIKEMGMPTNFILSSSTYSEKITLNSNKTIKTQYLQKTYAPFDFGLSFGFGYQLNKIILKAEYELATKPAFNYKTIYYYFGYDQVDENFKNRSFSISLVYCLYK